MKLTYQKTKKWGQRENAFHKKLIDNVIDGTIGPQGPRGYQGAIGPQPVVPTLNNNRYVSPSGNDSTGDGSVVKPYKTISGALAAINDNSTTNPYCINLAGGLYTESATLTVGAGIHILGTGDSTVITTSNNNVNLFNLLDQSDLSSVTIIGPTNAYTVSITDPGSIVSLKFIKFSNCVHPVYINGTDCTVNLYDLALRGSSVTMDNAIEVHAGDVNIYTLSIVGIKGTNIIYGTSSSSYIHAWVVNCESDSNMNTLAYITDGARFRGESMKCNVSGTAIYFDNATVDLIDTHINHPTIGIDMGPNGTSYLTMNGVNVLLATSLDMRIQNSTSSVLAQNTYLRDSFIEFTNGIPTIQYVMNHFSSDIGLESLITKASLAVGSPDRPSKASLGEGHAYTRGMIVYQYDTVNGFTDVTQQAHSYTGSTFGFSSVATNSAIYLSTTLKTDGTYVKFFGAEVKIDTAGVAGGGSILPEYWNGSAWVPFTVMRTNGMSPYYPTTTSLVSLPAGTYQFRFNARINDAWTANDPIGLGINTYWMRLRIASTITTSPLVEQVLLHSNQSKINSDGWMEFYGKARPVARMPWNYGMLQPAVSSPSNQDQFLSDTLDVGKIENLFGNNATDRIGFLAPVPFDMDTSTPIRLRWAVRYSDNTGDVIWNVRWGYSTSSDIVYTSQAEAPTTHATQQITTITEAVPSTIGQIKWHTVDLSVYGMNPRNPDGTSDILWVTIERDGTTDTFSGGAGFVAIAGDYLQWTIGGHLSYA